MEKEKRTSPFMIKWIMERTCLRKKNLSLEEANRIVDLQAAKGDLIYFYQCTFCNSYHMTSTPREPTKHLEIK